jgi:predicted alpha/beta superfamily hydrolase
MERVKREIFQSQAFDMVRQAQGGATNFIAFIEQKIEPVDGDIVRAVPSY